MKNNQHRKQINRAKGNGKELNTPNYKLMAKAFVNLYQEVGEKETRMK